MRARLQRLTRPNVAGKTQSGRVACATRPERSAKGRGELGGWETVRSGDLGELLGRDFDAAGQRRERLVGELEEGLGVLRAGRDESVEVAARDLALKLEQLGR